MGDPAEADFTEMLKAQFGWTFPPPEERTPWDMLPLCIQTHPHEQPKLFEVPPQYVARVPIQHPTIPEITEMGLQVRLS